MIRMIYIVLYDVNGGNVSYPIDTNDSHSYCIVLAADAEIKDTTADDDDDEDMR
eukprot:CAMPEP_0170822526 /NCGR_PEP_ID=MMETSP0733-20121128/43838_1 /TAXON_ID=186038 /ORGANISM="Fragilariopsis kerguelensis, Strain L26-C5" /LENGTH=53 /DNA_ID=CAMNT_0011184755 /DNA_START=384 /DNA_END=542 /DNA_ORIENTATION=-